jgi:hypothetical protein
MAKKFKRLRALGDLLNNLEPDQAELELGLERTVYVVMAIRTTERDTQKALGRMLHRIHVIYGKNNVRMFGPVAESDPTEVLGTVNHEIVPYNYRSDIE